MFERVKKPAENMTVPEQRTFPRMTLTVEQMADELNISRPTAYQLVKQKEFPSFRIGNRVLVNRERLQQWLDKQSDHAVA